MPVVSRVAVLALLCLLSVGSAVAQVGNYAFCYTLYGLNRTSPVTSLDDQYTIAVLVTGTYTTTQMTSVYNKTTGTAAGSYYNLLTATGTRTVRTRNTGQPTNWPLVVQNITGLFKSGDFADNRFYLSFNGTVPQFVDGDGLTFNVSVGTEFPGKLFATASKNYYNVYRTSIFGGVVEDQTAGIDLSQFNLTANFPGWTGNRYVAGSCVPPVFTYPGTSNLYPAGENVTVTYSISNAATDKTTWTVNVTATFPTTSALTQDQFGDIYLTLDNTKRLHVNGTRKYCVDGVCNTSHIYQVAPLFTGGFSDNRIYQYKPWFSYNGPAYLIDPPQPKPGYFYNASAANFTSYVNPYVSKASQFFEGFSNGGTGPNGKIYVPPTLPLAVSFS